MNQGSFKDFENVVLKANQRFNLGSRIIEEGEVVTEFSKATAAGFQSFSSYITANGGINNRTLIVWETTREEQITVRQGVFSKEQFALMSNSHLIEIAPNQVEIHKRDLLETDENNQVQCTYEPIKHLFVYNKNTGEKIGYTQDGVTLTLEVDPYTDVIVDYTYLYKDKSSLLRLGAPLMNGFLTMEGMTRVKDDETGKVVTGLIKVPKLKIISNLTFLLGTESAPILGQINAIAMPVGERGIKDHVCEFYYLQDDLTADF